MIGKMFNPIRLLSVFFMAITNPQTVDHQPVVGLKRCEDRWDCLSIIRIRTCWKGCSILNNTRFSDGSLDSQSSFRSGSTGFDFSSTMNGNFCMTER
jgi:hypothetical protein